jgi:predicted AlkP superfamily pyrophosphatase or phosphodiesterase
LDEEDTHPHFPAGGRASHHPASKPKLVLAIAVDQFRYDLPDAIARRIHWRIESSAYRRRRVTNANYEHSPTVTAIGRSTFLSGALLRVSGIVGNEWFARNRQTGHHRVRRLGPAARRLE